MPLYIDPATVTPYRTIEGLPFIQLFQVFPWLEPFYTNFEKNYSVTDGYSFVFYNDWLPFFALALYGLGIVYGNKYLKDKQPFDLKSGLAYWNLLLAVFSFLGAVRTVPHLLYFMASASFKTTVCQAPDLTFGDGATGFWCLLFTLSKLFELFDTAFIVMRKKKLLFLHWYHHVTVLLFTWFSYKARHPGIYFIAMNYSVHAFMYFYYYLMAIKAKPKWLNPMWITTIQINQMIVGIIISVAGFIYSSDPECKVNKSLLYFQAAMYGSYLYLFLEFMFKRFFGAGKKESIKKKI